MVLETKKWQVSESHKETIFMSPKWHSSKKKLLKLERNVSDLVNILTVLSSVSSTYCWDRSTPGHNQLVRVTLVVGGLRLGEDQVVHVKPVHEDWVRIGSGFGDYRGFFVTYGILSGFTVCPGKK